MAGAVAEEEVEGASFGGEAFEGEALAGGGVEGGVLGGEGAGLVLHFVVEGSDLDVGVAFEVVGGDGEAADEVLLAGGGGGELAVEVVE